MKRFFKTMAFTLLGLVLSVNLMAAETELSESLDLTGKTAGSAAYNSSTTYGDWTIVNGANNNKGWAYFKMGGKSATISSSNPCYIYYSANSGVSSKVDKITVSIAAGSLSKSGMSVNSWGVYVYSDKAMTTQVDYVAGGTIANSAATFDFTPSAGKTWAAGSYYKVSWDLANTTSTNGIICVDKVTLYSISDAPDPVLQSIAISGTPKTTYEAGEEFDITDLVVTGTYDTKDPEVITEGISWKITPSGALTAGTTSVSVTATIGEKSDTKQYNVTVTEHVVTPGTYEIVPNNTFFGIEAQTSGSHAAVTGKQNDITLTHSGGSNFYCNASQVRTYKDNTLTFSVPEGYEITSIVLAVTDNASYNADKGTYTASSKTWAGHAQQVVLTSAQSSGNYQITKITVTFAVAKVLSGIAVKTAPTKTTYYVGDDFDPAGLVITASYASGDPEDIAYTEDNKDAFSFSGFNSEAEATDQVITVTYAEKSATFTVDIEEARTLNSIEVATNPTKMVYEVGEALDLTGLVVNGIFSKGDPEPVEYTADPEDGTTLDAVGNTTVTLTSVDNTELTTSFDVTVNAIEGDRLTLASTGVSGSSYAEWSGKTGSEGVAVYAGKCAGGNSSIQLNTSNPQGLVSTTSGGLIRKVKVDWNSNTSSTGNRSIDIYGSNTAYTGSGDIYNTEKQGTKLGSIVCGTSTELVVEGDYEYVGIRAIGGALYMNSITFVWSAPKVLESIAVKTAPTVVDYAAGEFFNPAGLVITATYDDESTAGIAYEGNEDKFTFNPALDAALATTDEKVTITYGGKSCDQAITVKNIELTSIVVSGDPKNEYTEGDNFDFTGLVATGYYSDESHKTITDQVEWSIDPATLTAGQTSVSVIATSGLISGNKSYDITVAAAPLEVTWDATQQGYSNEQAVTEAEFNAIISAEFEGGKYYTTGTAVRVYGGKTFAIHAVSGYKITSIVIGFGTGDGSNTITADCGTYSNGTWTGSAKDVTFTVDGTSGNRRLKTFTVTYAVAGASAATPTITPSVDEAETYWEPITVTLATTTEEATIYYTTDGTEPTAASTLYEAAFEVSKTTTIKAIAVKDGLDNSEVATKTFNFGKVFDNIAACFADETLQNGDVVKISNVSAVITNFAASGKTVYFEGGSFYVNATYPNTYKIGGTLSGSNLLFTYMNYDPKQLRPESWGVLTYKDGEGSKEQGTITATYKTSLDIDGGNDVYEVTYNGDGELSVVSSNTDVATAVLSGTQVTITPKAAGSTTITISAPETDNYTEASKVYTLTVNPALAAASLPFDFTGGKDDINPANGIKQVGLGTDYKGDDVTTKLKFDNTGDYVLILLADAPASMKFDIKGNSFSNGTFDVLESADNVNFTSLASYTELDEVATEEVSLAATTRYIKFIYTNKEDGNVGLGNIHIAAPEPDFTLEDKAAGAYATICLPRKIDHVENATLFHISHGNINKVEFEEVTDFSEEPAGMPYLVQVTETGSVQFFCDENVTTTEPVSREDANGFVGSLQDDPQEVPNNGMSLLVSGGQLHLAAENCHLTKNHAYIDVYNVPANPVQVPNLAARRVTLYNAEAQTPTNFNGLNGNMKAQKVMKDGQFYIIREAKMYNAQGIEVQ